MLKIRKLNTIKCLHMLLNIFYINYDIKSIYLMIVRYLDIIEWNRLNRVNRLNRMQMQNNKQLKKLI